MWVFLIWSKYLYGHRILHSCLRVKAGTLHKEDKGLKDVHSAALHYPAWLQRVIGVDQWFVWGVALDHQHSRENWKVNMQ